MQSLQAYNVAYNAPADHYVAIEMMLFIYFLLFYLQRNLNIFNRSSGVAYLGYIGAQSGLQFCRPKNSVVTKAVASETEAKTEAAGSETEGKTEAEGSETEAEAQGSWLIF